MTHYATVIDLDSLRKFKQEQDAHNEGTYLGIHGTADTASRLDGAEAVGSQTRPVHFVHGLPVQCSHSVETDVPQGAVFTDTTYSDVEAGGASGLMSGADKSKLDGIEDGAEANIIEGVKVNGSELAPDAYRKVNVTVTAGDAASGVGSLKVNGSAVSVYGLGTAAARDVAASVADGEEGLVSGGAVHSAVQSALSSALTYKGAVQYVSDLPTSGNRVGDMWHVADTGGEYAWDGSAWQEMGSVVDLSGYVEDSDMSVLDDSAIDALFPSG